MGKGVDAVKSKLSQEFRVGRFAEHFNAESLSIDLGFTAEARMFVVRVSKEFDEDYGGPLSVTLERLAPVLRASKDGKATVRTIGIASGISS
jgi:hypothetical protein